MSDATPAMKFAARNAFTTAIKRGIIKRQPCENCGKANAQGHHSDYSKPLEVKWLCRGCHAKLHHSPAKSGNIVSRKQRRRGGIPSTGQLLKAGVSPAEIMALTGVSKRTVDDVMKRLPSR